MPNFFLKIDDEFAQDRLYILEYMRENKIERLEVFKAVIDTVTGFLYCKHFGEIGEVGFGCGKECSYYTPRNGKNGRCRHSAHTYSPGESITIDSKIRFSSLSI